MAGSEGRPKILLVGGDGRLSGVPRHILHLTKALRRQAQITVVSDRDQGGYTPLAKMQVRHIEIAGLRNSFSPWLLFQGLRDLLRLCASEAPELIWVHARLPALLMRIARALRIWRPDCHVMFTYHGLPFGPGHHPVAGALSRLIEGLLLHMIPPVHLVFLNHRMAHLMAGRMPQGVLARHRIHILENCSDLRPHTRKALPDVRTLVMTGRTGRQKDYEYAARLFAHLPENFRLLMCGPGTESISFQRGIAGILPSDTLGRVSFAGPLSDVRDVLQQADAYLLTSRYEGVPIGALEAFEAGLPIILRNFDGAADLVAKHPCGLLIGQVDQAEDAHRIDQMLDQFYAREHEFSEKITKAWSDIWSPGVFNQNACNLIAAVLNASKLFAPDCDHGDPAPHPDHHRNTADPVPIQQPWCTDALPSAGNG